MRIRPATIEDAPEIARLSRAQGYASSTEQILARLDGLLGHRDRFIAVADLDRQALLGWIAVERRLLLESGEKAEIVGLIVSQDRHRQGVGSALVDAAEDWARALHLPTLAVRSNEARIASHPFYQARGFERAKTQHVYIKTLDRESRHDHAMTP
ncbi:GNAT family N-acetyltransferase [Marinobacter sp. JSM 1782161]|uniref:GNAT family N-acetyltransferase n=1 Tax=Marinobacter sp. JSM 1782161 TaxID=2685906 RepID=UPI0014022266|nr:GNAT family N-acetyltransferase [Marinobacter sp. JSM 1782161]